MNIRTCTVVLCVFVTLNSFADATEPPKPILKNPLPLTRVALLTDLDAPADDVDPGTGGAFDNTAFFQNKLTDASATFLLICTES